ncbi:17364_t:CDS:2, partial [Rhizophagus irregularis]
KYFHMTNEARKSSMWKKIACANFHFVVQIRGIRKDYFECHSTTLEEGRQHHKGTSIFSL